MQITEKMKYYIMRRPLYISGRQFDAITNEDAKVLAVYEDKTLAEYILKTLIDFNSRPPGPMQASPVHHFIVERE